MCSRNTTPVNDSTQKYVGQSCPVCTGQGVTLDFMRFLDPHGAERLDSEIFECSARRHTFVYAEGGLRLLAAEIEHGQSQLKLSETRTFDGWSVLVMRR